MSETLNQVTTWRLFYAIGGQELKDMISFFMHHAVRLA